MQQFFFQFSSSIDPGGIPMSDEVNTSEGFSMQKGHDLVRKGKPYAALNHFRDVAERKPVTYDVVIAMQTLALVYRSIRQLAPAIEYLEKALTEAQNLKDSELEASILRDIEETRNAVKPHRTRRNRKGS
jgi:tetratricopeptide (TPR) repeat protein